MTLIVTLMIMRKLITAQSQGNGGIYGAQARTPRDSKTLWDPPYSSKG